MLNSEIWVDLPNVPYQITKSGKIRRNPATFKTGRRAEFIKPYKNNKGYLCVHFWVNGKMSGAQVHRLLAQTFIPNPNNLPEVNHIDGNPLNNSLNNLEWVTHQQNLKHAWETGLFKRDRSEINIGRKSKNATSKYNGVSWSEQRQKWCVQVKLKGKLYLAKRFKNEVEAAKAYDKCVIENNLTMLFPNLNFR